MVLVHTGLEYGTDRTKSYESSLSSSASSQDSIFSHFSSGTLSSTQSSCPDNDFTSAEQWRAVVAGTKAQQLCHRPSLAGVACLPLSTKTSAPLPSEQRQHPRRSSSGGMKKAPALVRQNERKVLFVNDLVDSATNMVEVIWPLSVVPGHCTAQSGQGRGVLPLRRYIEETLRRSRTSYSTLQVALYYLILIKVHVPKCDFTMEQPIDCPSLRALQCGRRMFLAALILASKYLQDRNYSAKAWSKMSGLNVAEINANERSFLSAVNWKLHIPDHIFKRWTEIVLKFTAPPSPPTPGQATAALDNKSRWSHIMPLLTPDLNIPTSPRCPLQKTSTVSSWSPAPTTPTPVRPSLQGYLSSKESTPTPTNMAPRFCESNMDLVSPIPPALARMGPLPTPQMTPSSIASSTPAVSACSSRRPSMGMAMAQAQNNTLCRMTVDHFPGQTANPDLYSNSRSSSLAPSQASSGSSPDSMISDFSRSSRASSISSVSTASTGAPNQPACLARLATCRKARLPRSMDCPTKSIEGTEIQPITIMDDVDIMASPDFNGFSIRDDSATPVRPAGPTSAPSRDGCRKRVRAHIDLTDDSELQDTVCSLLREKRSEVEKISPDNSVAASPISPCVFRQALQSLSQASPPSSVKSVQPPCTLVQGSSNRIPVCNDTGRKRTCCSTRAASQTSRDEIPDLFMAVQPGTWMSV